MDAVNSVPSVPAGFRVIFRAWYTDKNGNRIYARDYGKRGFRLVIRSR